MIGNKWNFLLLATMRSVAHPGVWACIVFSAVSLHKYTGQPVVTGNKYAVTGDKICLYIVSKGLWHLDLLKSTYKSILCINIHIT